MSSHKKSKLEIVNLFISEFDKEFTKTPSNDLFCKICGVIVSYKRRSSVLAHRKTAMHNNKSKLMKGEQSFLDLSNKSFAMRISNAFLCSDIPLYKLRNPSIKELFNSIGHPIPSETTCRNAMEQIYTDKYNSIKNLLENKKVFLIIDETSHLDKKYFNILIGDIEMPTKTFLIETFIVKNSLNAKEVVEYVNTSLKNFAVKIENFILLVSDAARYMVKAGEIIKKNNNNLFHITCIAHLLHNCALKIKDHFINVNCLISTIKTALIKCKDRQNMFYSIPLPPYTIVTRWGSWLSGVEYYFKYLVDVRKIVLSFEDDGKIVKDAKDAVMDKNLAKDILTIMREYGWILKLLKNCENISYTIDDAITSIGNVIIKNDVVGIMGYIKERLLKNDIMSIVNMKNDDISPIEYSNLLNCNPTSIAVERSFSYLQNLLRENRNFKEENIKKYLFLQYNK